MDGSERTRGAGGILDGLLELLFPTRCVFCRRLSGRGEPVCKACRERYPDVPPAQRVRHLAGLDCLAPLWYTGRVRDALLRYKFRDRSGYAPVFGNFMRKCLDENRISCDSITWVPLNRRRLRQRGYDQARLLAEDLSRRLSVPCLPTLQKIRNNPRQSAAGNAEKRRRNVKGVYAALPEADPGGKTILLVDDIVTTGATLSEAASVLRKAGAASVIGLTLARRKE